MMRWTYEATLSWSTNIETVTCELYGGFYCRDAKNGKWIGYYDKDDGVQDSINKYMCEFEWYRVLIKEVKK